jgi:hypothetical protein
VTDIDIKTQKETYRDRRIDTDIRRQTVAVKEDRDYKNRKKWTEADRGRHRQNETYTDRQRRVETERETYRQTEEDKDRQG